LLDTLRIKNLALIDDIEIEFDKGLNIITGETGAGKSIIVNSLQLILGKKASSDIIRADEDTCKVEAIFNLDDLDDFLIIQRILTKSNKNKVKINDEYVTIHRLKEVTEKIIDFSAQNQYLFDSSNQLFIFDLFCNLQTKKDKYYNIFKRYKELEKILEEEEEKKEKVKEEIEILKYQLKELEDANLDDFDEIELRNKIKFYEKVEIIKETLNFISQVFESQNFNLTTVKQKLHEIVKLKPSFEEIFKLIENIEIEVYEILNICVQELSELPEDTNELDNLIEIEEKLNFLKKKYKQNTIDELVHLKDKKKKELHKLENLDFKYREYREEFKELKKQIINLAEELHKIRLKFKGDFERKIIEILKDLNMEQVNFVVKMEKLDSINKTGITRLEFLISTNEGEEPKPIKYIASGGEKSRIMLALKSVLSEYLNIPVLIFDEIDAGTGGKTAFIIGKLLKKLSKSHQVFAITHFPQVAAFADNHYKVYKIVENGKTYTRIKKLNDRERIEELSRMISGSITEKSLLSAEEILNEAEKSNS